MTENTDLYKIKLYELISFLENYKNLDHSDKIIKVITTKYSKRTFKLATFLK